MARGAETGRFLRKTNLKINKSAGPARWDHEESVAKKGPGGGGEERREEGRGEGQGGGVGCRLRVGPALLQVWAGFNLF